MKKVSFLFIIFLIFSIGVWGYTQAISREIEVCVKKNGGIFMIGENFKRNDCLKNEKLISWNITGPQGIKGARGEQGPAGPQGKNGEPGLSNPSPRLYDANGQDLGTIISVIDNKINGIIFTYSEKSKSIIRFADQTEMGNPNSHIINYPKRTISFLEKDCKGDPFVARFSDPFNFNSLQISIIDNRSFKLIPGNIVYKEASSDLILGQGCLNYDNGTSTIEMYPVKETEETPFLTPIKWPLEIK